MTTKPVPPKIDFMQHGGLAMTAVGMYNIKSVMTTGECFQEAMMGLWRAADTYDPSLGKWSAYAMLWARSAIMARLHHPYAMPTVLRDQGSRPTKYARNTRKETPHDEDACGAEASKHGETREMIELAMRVLSDDERQVIRLRYLDGLKTYEIAKVMGLSRQSLVPRHASALRKLKREITRLRIKEEAA